MLWMHVSPSTLQFDMAPRLPRKEKGHRKMLIAKAKALAPLNAELRKSMSPRIAMVAGDVDVGFWIYLCVLLASVDYTFPARMQCGFGMCGLYEDVPAFRKAGFQIEKLGWICCWTIP